MLGIVWLFFVPVAENYPEVLCGCSDLEWSHSMLYLRQKKRGETSAALLFLLPSAPYEWNQNVALLFVNRVRSSCSVTCAATKRKGLIPNLSTTSHLWMLLNLRMLGKSLCNIGGESGWVLFTGLFVNKPFPSFLRITLWCRSGADLWEQAAVWLCVQGRGLFTSSIVPAHTQQASDVCVSVHKDGEKEKREGGRWGRKATCC